MHGGPRATRAEQFRQFYSGSKRNLPGAGEQACELGGIRQQIPAIGVKTGVTEMRRTDVVVDRGASY